MKNNSFLFALVASLALLSSFCTNHNSIAVNKNYTSAAKGPGFAVVELFTSEGCSSCPAAEKAVEELQKQYSDEVYVLAFHVDYWNRLGWTDSFSRADYTQRQNAYASQFGLSSIYTPQVVVNGRQEFVGSDKTKLQAATTAELKNAARQKIAITVTQPDATTVTVAYETEGAQGGQIHFALLQSEASTDVVRGENSGRKLHHINIVRDFKTTGAANGTVHLRIPSGLNAKDIQVVAYLQQQNGTITAVQKTNIGII